MCVGTTLRFPLWVSGSVTAATSICFILAVGGGSVLNAPFPKHTVRGPRDQPCLPASNGDSRCFLVMGSPCIILLLSASGRIQSPRRCGDVHIRQIIGGRGNPPPMPPDQQPKLKMWRHFCNSDSFLFKLCCYLQMQLEQNLLHLQQRDGISGLPVWVGFLCD